MVAILAVGTSGTDMSPVSEATRIATRCPNCKGALIKRGAGWTHGASVWFYCFFCKHAWKGRPGESRASSDGELTGQMLVVARRKVRHALPAVLVHAIPADALKKHVERRTAQGALRSAKLQREIDVLAGTLAEARAEEERLWNIQSQDEANLQAAKAWSVAYANTKKITGQLEDLRTRRQQVTSAEYFLKDLPTAISTATTDADGTFTLTIPRHGPYGITACASRAVDDEEQTYCWCVWISLDGESAKHLVLNNDNTMGAGSPDSALT
jgi:hypothetical protein